MPLDLSPAVVDRAIEKLQDLGLVTQRVGYDWKVTTSERERSTVHRLVDRPSGTTLYYKIHKADGKLMGGPDSLHRRLSRTQRLNDRLLQLTLGRRISAARVLVVDPDAGIVVSLGVPGREFGQRGYMPGPLRKSTVLDELALIGGACATVERAGESADAVPDVDRLTAYVNNTLTRSTLSPSQSATIAELVGQLAARRISDGSSIFVHGDLSPSNIIMAPDQITLIDFSWKTRYKGFDVGVLSYRLFGWDRYAKWWGRQARSALMRGYLEEAGQDVDTASLRLVDLLLMIRSSVSMSRRTRVLAAATLQGLASKGDEALGRTGDEDSFAWSWETGPIVRI